MFVDCNEKAAILAVGVTSVERDLLKREAQALRGAVSSDDIAVAIEFLKLDRPSLEVTPADVIIDIARVTLDRLEGFLWTSYGRYRKVVVLDLDGAGAEQWYFNFTAELKEQSKLPALGNIYVDGRNPDLLDRRLKLAA